MVLQNKGPHDTSGWEAVQGQGEGDVNRLACVLVFRLDLSVHTAFLNRSVSHASKKLQAMGFEPMPLSRLAPKASALTTRPNLQKYIPRM
jgi:hypothetical protein